MKGLVFVAGLVALILVMPLIGQNEAFAQCKSEVSVKRPVDYQLPVSSGTYDPCDNWLKWTMEFVRSQQAHDNKGISLEVSGTSVYETFMAADYSPGYHSDSGVEYVGPSSSHELILDTTIGSNGQFTGIVGTVNY